MAITVDAEVAAVPQQEVQPQQQPIIHPDTSFVQHRHQAYSYSFSFRPRAMIGVILLTYVLYWAHRLLQLQHYRHCKADLFKIVLNGQSTMCTHIGSVLHVVEFAYNQTARVIIAHVLGALGSGFGMSMGMDLSSMIPIPNGANGGSSGTNGGGGGGVGGVISDVFGSLLTWSGNANRNGGSSSCTPSFFSRKPNTKNKATSILENLIGHVAGFN